MSPNKANTFFSSIGVMNYLVHIYRLLCALEATGFGKKREMVCLFSFLLYSFIFVFCPFPESAMFSSMFFVHMKIVRGLKKPSPALGPSSSPGSLRFLLQEFER